MALPAVGLVGFSVLVVSGFLAVSWHPLHGKREALPELPTTVSLAFASVFPGTALSLPPPVGRVVASRVREYTVDSALDTAAASNGFLGGATRPRSGVIVGHLTAVGVGVWIAIVGKA